MITHPQLHELYRAMVGFVDPATVNEEDRAWVRHINAGLMQYQARSGASPFLLAVAGAFDAGISKGEA
jgi:hypothetical protein